MFCVVARKDPDEPFFLDIAFKENPPRDFDYYHDKNREACFAIPEWDGIRGFYEVYDAIRAEALKASVHQVLQTASLSKLGRLVVLRSQLVQEFNERFKRKEVDKDLVVLESDKREQAAESIISSSSSISKGCCLTPLF